jgi:hypothetical protein
LKGTHLLAGRVSYDFNENLRMGTIFTNDDPQGRRKNTPARVDAVWRTSTFRGNDPLWTRCPSRSEQVFIEPATAPLAEAEVSKVFHTL